MALPSLLREIPRFHTIRPVLVSDFDFELPPELIAQQPPAERGGSRMLTLNRETGAWQDSWFNHLPELLREGDVLVLNDSRVIPARLFGTRLGKIGPHPQAKWKYCLPSRSATGNGARWPVPHAGWRWVKSSPSPRPTGSQLLQATVVADGDFGERLLRFTPVDDFFARLEVLGHVPLPPYIRRPRARPLDRERYQTVFARQRGSVAAPTAGLHFTPEILERIRARGVVVTHLTLHVGLGTFQPVRVAEVAEIRLHAERYSLPEETALQVNRALLDGRRVVAAGTTTVRTLEHCARIGRLEPHTGTTSIFLSPGSRFHVVGALLTNFHLPQSTLLMLVSAFAGKENTLAAYRHAVEAGYRFFSYGDCMFICLRKCRSAFRRARSSAASTSSLLASITIGSSVWGTSICRPQLIATREKGLGMRKLIPRPQQPGFFRMRVKDADGVPGELGQLHRSRLDLVHRPPRPIRGKNRWMSTLHRPSQRQQTAAPEARARSPRGQKAEPFNGARDQFAVEAAADQYRHPEPAVKIAGTGNKAAVPETPHLKSRRGCRLGARLHHHFVAQGSMRAPATAKPPTAERWQG